MTEDEPVKLDYRPSPRPKRPLWSFKDGAFELRGDFFILMALAICGCVLAWMIWVTAMRLWM